MQAYEVLAGDMIFSEGDEGAYACVIRKGRVQILKHTPQGEVELAILQEGDVFGEMALFEPSDTRSASARALDHVIVDVLSAEAMKELLQQSPPMLQPFMSAMVGRLREMNRRLAEKARATVLLGHSINTLHLMPANSVMQELVFPVEIKTANLPYTIGGYEKDKPAPKRRNLEIMCVQSPMNISYEHCSIEHHDDGVYVVDNGSRFRTIVNGKSIGRGEATSKALLLPNENSVILGDPLHQMKLLIRCE
jgi:CRP/FNR family transcriptional regulator, cyclic AMP receptor protein